MCCDQSTERPYACLEDAGAIIVGHAERSDYPGLPSNSQYPNADEAVKDQAPPSYREQDQLNDQIKPRKKPRRAVHDEEASPENADKRL